MSLECYLRQQDRVAIDDYEIDSVQHGSYITTIAPHEMHLHYIQMLHILQPFETKYSKCTLN